MIPQEPTPDSTSPLQNRWELCTLVAPGAVGVELGVAAGGFSELLLQRGSFEHFYSIDMYGDKKHGVEEYVEVAKRLSPYRARNTLMRCRFDECVGIFPDGYFDFVYVDGYASGGEEGGRTFEDWWPKVAPGGVFGGHDYDEAWPLVIESVDRFCKSVDRSVMVVGGMKSKLDQYNRYKSWYIRK